MTEVILLEITYKNKKLQKVCTDPKVSDKKYGSEMSEKIKLRIFQIKSAPSVEFMIQYGFGRCHSLTGDRKGQYAMDLVQPYRLVFKKLGREIQFQIIEIVDYH